MRCLPTKVMTHTENDAIAITKSGRNGYFTQIQMQLQEGLCANISHGLQEIVIQFVLMYNMMNVLLPTYYQESGHFISSICLFELLMTFHKADLFYVKIIKKYVHHRK